MEREEIEQGKAVVEKLLTGLCSERNMSLSGPLVWTEDFDRMRFWLEVEVNGRRVTWPFSFEQLEDSVEDKSVRRNIERALAQYVLPDSTNRATSSTTAIRCNPSTDPVIVLDFDCHRPRPAGAGMRVVRDNEFILKNKGGIDAINVHIEDIVLDKGTASFRAVSAIAPGAEHVLKATIPGKGVILGHDWEDVLMDEWNSKGSLEPLGSIGVEITYSDYAGNHYRTRHEIEYDVFNGTADTRFLDCTKSEKEHHSSSMQRGGTRVVSSCDVFISHATEDKPYVEPLVKALQNAGVQVWFDKSSLEWGDDLRSAIDRGLTNCRYGIVVFSKAFLARKKWTEYELNSLFAREEAGKKLILPIWHGITREDVLQYGPGFADRLAKISSSDSYDDIVASLLRLLGRPASTGMAERNRSENHTATQSEQRPNAIAYARYETTGEGALRAEAFVRPSIKQEGWYTFENSFGEFEHGDKANIAMRFVAFDRGLRMKGYIRMQSGNASGDKAFDL